MKLIKLLENLDEYTRVKLVIYEKSLNEDYELYTGDADDVPWIYANMKIDTDENGRGICATLSEDDNRKIIPCIKIYLKEN